MRIKGVILVRMVMEICVMEIEINLWLREILMEIVVMGEVWEEEGIGNGEDEKVKLREVERSEMEDV